MRINDPAGLMLTPDADHLFDRGFISFADDGAVLVSARVPHDDLRRLGFDELTHQRLGFAEVPPVWTTGPLEARQRDCMAYHRAAVFIDAEP